MMEQETLNDYGQHTNNRFHLDILTEEAGNFGPGVPVVAHQRKSAP